MAAPRDNVVFEAGDSAKSKGKRSCAHYSRERFEMPADLGAGTSMLFLKTVDDTSDVKPYIRRFVEQRSKLSSCEIWLNHGWSHALKSGGRWVLSLSLIWTEVRTRLK